MNDDIGVLAFLSRASAEDHREYLELLKTRFSVLVRDEPRLRGAAPLSILRLPIGKSVRSEAAALAAEIAAHELFFDSFSSKRAFCPALRRRFGSENGFLYEVLRAAKEAISSREEFLTVGRDSRGEIVFSHGDALTAVTAFDPIFAIDLCEHAYFSDYKFDKEKYLLRAVSYLNLRKITDLPEGLASGGKI